ncbi:MAG: family 16 glycosylhydrolase [Eubacterium sp.]
MLKYILPVILIIIAVIVIIYHFTGFNREYTWEKNDKWKTKFDTSLPFVENAGNSKEAANSDGWYMTLCEDFDGDSIPNLFAYSPHGLRVTEYWCDQAISFKDSNAVITAFYDSNHVCNVCKAKQGNFTGGIETRIMKDNESVPLFQQAFGYFEARVKLPESGGMWAAFWLQSDSVKNVGNGGEDGTEIDIFESSFFNTNKAFIGHALHYDGYSRKHHKCFEAMHNIGTNLYDGYHTFALKWTPNEYVFYVDGIATWASDFGGVSKVPAFLRFTNEIRPKKIGPYGQRLGNFTGGEFYVDYVKVYQNINYLDSIKSPLDFSY